MGEIPSATLGRASVGELMACGQFSREIVEAIIQTRGPEGVLTMDKLVATTGVDQERWMSLVRNCIKDDEHHAISELQDV